MAPLYIAVVLLFATVNAEGMFRSHSLGAQSRLGWPAPLTGQSAPGSVWPKPQQSTSSDMVSNNLICF